MASGYNSLLYRLSGMIPSDRPSPGDDVESLKDSLAAYFLGDSLDEVSRDLCWKNFAIPALLIALHDFMESDAHRIRINEFFYRELDRSVQSALGRDLSPSELASECEDRVFGAMSLVIDMGSVSATMKKEDLMAFMYEFFPGLEDFLRLVNPTSTPFVTGPLSLNRLADYLLSIQVCFFVYTSICILFSPLIGCLFVNWIVILSIGVVILVYSSK